MLPNFFIVGVAKSGTTSLYRYLAQHPEIFMCTPKEPDFFIDGGRIERQDEYEALFEEADAETSIGEASVSYFHHPYTAQRIKRIIPDAQFILVLRDPAERAYSHYNMLINHAVIPKRPYIESLVEARRKGNFKNTGIPHSQYAESLGIFFDVFGSNAFSIYFHKDLKEHSQETLKSILQFLDVDSSFQLHTDRQHNTSKVPRSEYLNRILHSGNVLKSLYSSLVPARIRERLGPFVHHINSTQTPQMSKRERKIAIDLLMQDIVATEQILDIDLSRWKEY